MDNLAELREKGAMRLKIEGILREVGADVSTAVENSNLPLDRLKEEFYREASKQIAEVTEVY